MDDGKGKKDVQLIFFFKNILKYKTDHFITQPTESFEKLKDHDAKQMILTNLFSSQ